MPSGARRSLASGELLVSQVSSDRLPLGAGGRRIQSMKVLQGGIDPPKSLTVPGIQSFAGAITRSARSKWFRDFGYSGPQLS